MLATSEISSIYESLSDDYPTFDQSNDEWITDGLGVLDDINKWLGKGTLRPACFACDPEWAMKSEMRSQRYKTQIRELWTVKCN